MKKLFIKCMITTSLIAPILISTEPVSANSIEFQNRETSELNNQDQEFSNLISQYTIEEKQSNGDVVRYISDTNLKKAYYQAYGVSNPQLFDSSSDEISSRRSNGVSKIIWRKGKGNADVYLSKNMLNFIRSRAIGTGVAAIGALTGGAGSVFIAKVVVGQIIGNAAPKFGAGRVYYVRNYRPAGWRYQ